MKSKNYFLTLLMALFVPLAAWAQAPTGLECLLSPADGTVAYLKWDPAGSETQWTLHYGTDPDFGTYSTKQVANVPQQRLTGLTAGTTYYARVTPRWGTAAYSNTCSFTPKDFHQIGTIDFGSGNTAPGSSHLPFNTGTAGGFSVQAYDGSTIPEGYINKIYFHLKGSPTESGQVAASRNIRIYMSYGELAGSWGNYYTVSSYDDVIFHGHDKVFEGQKTFKNGWNEIVLDKSFRFDKTFRDHNLFVWIEDVSGGISAHGSLLFSVNQSDWMGSLYTDEDVSSLDLKNKGGRISEENDSWFLTPSYMDNPRIELENYEYVNVIRLGYESMLYKGAEVYGLYTDVTGEGSAILRWVGYAQHFVLQYGTSENFASNQTTTKYLYDEPFYLSGLSPTQTYYWRVKAVGAFDETDWSVGTSFKPSKQVAIGSGTETGFNVPFNSYYNYYLSQQIYTKAEMNKAGVVESVTFECSSISTPETRNLDIYMVHTDKTQFNSKSDWVQVTPDDLVFSGPVTFQNGLNRIRFNSGFEYDGQRNVVLVIDDNTGERGSRPNFAIFTTTSNQSITYGNQFSNIDVQNTSGINQNSVDLYQKKNRVTFEINTPSGMNKPTGLVATLDPDTPTEATLGWTENGTATRWDVRYGTDPSFADCQTMEVSDTPQAQLTGLTPETTYYASVRSLKSNGLSAWSAPVAFVPTDKIVVGAGEANSAEVPISGFLLQGMSQQIYTADEFLNEPRLIESISFWSDKAFDRRALGIALMHTDKEEFDGTGYMDTDNSVSVFPIGQVSFVANGWTTIHFTTPFAYDGTSNVVLTVLDMSGPQSGLGMVQFKAFETGRNQAYCNYSDNGNYLYGDEGLLSTKKNQVRWGVSAVCETPWHHESQVAYFPGNGVDVWWFEMGEATEWTVQHGVSYDFAEGTYTEMTVTGEPYAELRNITPYYGYYVRVRSECGDGLHSLWSDVIMLNPKDEIFITGEDGTPSQELPTNFAYKSSLTQQIYTKDELQNLPCAIGSIRFIMHNYYLDNRDLDIYMVHTDKTEFDGISDWVSVTSDDLVFSGNTSVISTITFNKRFMYDGKSNVVLVVNDKTNSNDETNCSFMTFNSGKNQALYARTNWSIINPLGDLNAADGITMEKNKIYLGWEENPCMKPTMHEATLTPNNATVATLNWTENGAATEWVLQYGASDDFYYDFAEGTYTELTVTGTPTFNLTGLSPWTYYQARVRAVVREGEATYYSDWSQAAMFMTEQKIEVGTEAQVWHEPLPTHIKHNYSLTQQIYTNDELLNEPRIIRSIDFQKMYGPASRKLKIYMVHTNKDEFTSSVTDWLKVTADNLVFDGYANFQGGDQWSTITFDTPFAYNGTSNVALVVYDETNETSTEHYAFKCFNDGKYRAIGITSSSSIDPLSANPGIATYFNFIKNMVRFGWDDLGYVIVSPGHPYEFGFETAGDNWTAGEWNVEYTTTPHSGEQCAYMSNAAVSELVSPEIHFDESCDNIVVRFWMKGSGRLMAHYGENLERETLIVTFSNNYNQWTKQEISLSRFMASQTVKALKIGFRNDYPNTSKEMWIDDFEVVANAYDKVFDPGAQAKQWSAAVHWYPHNVPTSSDNVFIGGIAFVGSEDGSNTYTASANTIGFGTQLGYLRVYQGSILEAAQINYRASNNVTIYDGGQLKVGSDIYAKMFKRFIGYDNANSTDHWYLFASPLKGTITNSVLTEGEYDLYGFDGTADLEWLNNKNHSFNLSNGKGYLYAHAKPTTGSNDYTEVSFTGMVYNANANRTVTGLTYGENTEANPFYNWNLVGNPYPCNAYLSGNRAFYRLEETAEGSRIVLAEDNVIKPMEGVFVQAETAEESSVTFTTTAPNSGRGAMDFTVSKHSSTRDGANVVADRARISFSQGKGMSHLDLMADANRLYIPQSGKDMAVVCSEPAGEMPLNFEAAENGTYTLGISLNDTELVYCHLIDNLTGADVDLLATSTGSVAEYTFEAKTTDYRSRFKVVFVAKSAFEGDNANNFAFFNQGNWIIANEGRATLQVIDMNGRILSSESINGNATKQINAAAGMYLLRLVNGNDVKTQKIVVD